MVASDTLDADGTLRYSQQDRSLIVVPSQLRESLMKAHHTGVVQDEVGRVAAGIAVNYLAEDALREVRADGVHGGLRCARSCLVTRTIRSAIKKSSDAMSSDDETSKKRMRGSRDADDFGNQSGEEQEVRDSDFSWNSDKESDNSEGTDEGEEDSVVDDANGQHEFDEACEKDRHCEE